MNREAMKLLPLRLTVLAFATALLALPASAQTATETALAARLDALARELAQVRAELAALQQQPALAATAAAVPAAAQAPAENTEPRASATVLSSYGEINYSRPSKNPAAATADLRRFVLGTQHRFDAKTKVVAELEVEHAVSSASDPGEVALEQAYVERQLGPTLALRAGLFLMPAGLINENHEPTAFYGVERNRVETAIIPSTWREGGVQLVHAGDDGLTLQGGISTGFDLNKWDATAAESRGAPLAAVHQELALARAHDLAFFGAANWRGMPGLLLGASVFSGAASQGQLPQRSRITLWDVHARYSPGRWDFAALLAQGRISQTAAFNAPLVGSASLLPQRFGGSYAQAAYKLWSRGELALWPFVRAERVETASRYADLGPGLTPARAPAERWLTVGASWIVASGMVVKADLQQAGDSADGRRFNLGLGWSF